MDGPAVDKFTPANQLATTLTRRRTRDRSCQFTRHSQTSTRRGHINSLVDTPLIHQRTPPRSQSFQLTTTTSNSVLALPFYTTICRRGSSAATPPPRGLPPPPPNRPLASSQPKSRNQPLPSTFAPAAATRRLPDRSRITHQRPIATT